MKRATFLGLILSFFLVGLSSAAAGEASAPTTQGQIRFMGAQGCALGFAYRGFPPGMQGRMDLYFKGSLFHTFYVDVPSPSGIVTLHGVGTFIPHPFHGHREILQETVGFRATAQGTQAVVMGRAEITCYCGGEGGGGGGGIGGGGGGGSGGAGIGLGEAGPATPVPAQPSFTG
jgi:hypothetical protein